MRLTRKTHKAVCNYRADCKICSICISGSDKEVEKLAELHVEDTGHKMVCTSNITYELFLASEHETQE